MTRRRLACIAGTASLIAAVGCPRSDSPPAATQPTTSAPESVVRVALLHPGRENDGGWNQLACTALRTLRERRGVDTSATFAPNRSTFKSDLRDYAGQGYTLVVCHGSEYVKAAREVARDFPRAHFLVTGSADAGEGVATLDLRLWEATYLCGIIAAGLVPEGPAGLIGGQDIVTVRHTMNAFARGARSVKPGYPTFAQYVGSWDDVARAQQTAASLIDTRGTKVLFQNADAASHGIFEAARKAGVFVFGANSDQKDALPDLVPASAVIDMERAFEQVLDAIAAGTFRDQVLVGDLRSGIVDAVVNPRFEGRLSPATRSALAAARRQIIAGQLDVLGDR